MSVLDYMDEWYARREYDESEECDDAIILQALAIGYWKCVICGRSHPPSHNSCWWCNPTYDKE